MAVPPTRSGFGPFNKLPMAVTYLPEPLAQELAAIKPQRYSKLWNPCIPPVTRPSGNQRPIYSVFSFDDRVVFVAGEKIVSPQDWQIGTSRKNAAGAAFLRDFVEQAKASGLVARLIERHTVRGLSVAPPDRSDL